MASPSSSSAALEPLSFSLPRRGGGTGNQAQKTSLLRLVGPLGSIFCSSETLFENDIEKTSKKARKSRILASQTPPKTLPKWLQNRCSKKHAIFHGFGLKIFSVAKMPTSISYWFFQYFLLVGHFSLHRFFHVFSV